MLLLSYRCFPTAAITSLLYCCFLHRRFASTSTTCSSANCDLLLVAHVPSQVAAATAGPFNPSARITPIFGNIKDAAYDVGWFQQFDVVLNALDNLGELPSSSPPSLSSCHIQRTVALPIKSKTFPPSPLSPSPNIQATSANAPQTPAGTSTKCAWPPARPSSNRAQQATSAKCSPS